MPAGLKINKTNTRHSPSARHAASPITCWEAISSRMSAGQTKRHVRSQVPRLDKLTSKQRVSLSRMISYITGFEPDFMNVLITKYGAS